MVCPLGPSGLRQPGPLVFVPEGEPSGVMVSPPLPLLHSHSIVGPSICLPVGKAHGMVQAQQALVQRIGKAPGSAEW